MLIRRILARLDAERNSPSETYQARTLRGRITVRCKIAIPRRIDSRDSRKDPIRSFISQLPSDSRTVCEHARRRETRQNKDEEEKVTSSSSVTRTDGSIIERERKWEREGGEGEQNFWQERLATRALYLIPPSRRVSFFFPCSTLFFLTANTHLVRRKETKKELCHSTRVKLDLSY